MGSSDGPNFAGRIVSGDAETEEPRLAHRRFRLPRWIVYMVVVTGIFLSPFLLLGGGLLVFIFASSDTIYSKGYSERSFKRLRVGMTTSEVEAVMGPPLSKEPWHYPDQEPGQWWKYSKKGSVEAIYYIRALYFKGGRLDQVQMELFYE